MKNKKGFTLVELLAVVVILAILATAAFTLVLPKINESRKKSFLSEAGEIIKAAELYCSEHTCDDVKLGIKADLLEGGYLQKQGAVDAASGSITTWGGVVQIKKITTDGSTLVKYEYYINFRNENYKTNGCPKYKNLTVDSIQDAGTTNAANLSCNN